MRKKPLLLGGILALLVVAAAALFWPRTLSQTMGGDFAPHQLTAIQADLTSPVQETRTLQLTPQDPAFQQLLALLESSRYVFWYPGSGPRQVTLGYTVTLTFSQEMAVSTLTLCGDKAIDIYNGSQKACRATGGQAFQEEVLDFLLSQPAT